MLLGVFFDEKDLSVGDIIDLINKDDGGVFGEAEIAEIREKPFGEINKKDFEEHEKFKNEEETDDCRDDPFEVSDAETMLEYIKSTK